MRRTGAILTPILRNLRIEEGARLARIRNNWQFIFDRPLSSHMSPVKLSEGELLLNVDSHVWLQQLNYYKRDITKKLDSFGVRHVRFRLGRIRQEEKHKSHVEEMEELSPEDSRFASELASDIRDEDLRSAVINAIEKSLKSAGRKIKRPDFMDSL